MSGKLKDYQVLDVLCGGTFYKVRHKVTNNIFAWKACDCSAYSNEQIRNVVNEVKTISKLVSKSVLRYYDTILHSPSKTLYFVLEFNSWRSLELLVADCRASEKYIAEWFVWHLLYELTRVCKLVEDLNLLLIRKCITTSSVFVGERCELRVNCFELGPEAEAPTDLMRQVGALVRAVCMQSDVYDEIKQCYSDDLHDVISFLTCNQTQNNNLHPDTILYYPTVLANLETLSTPKHLNNVLVSISNTHMSSKTNKCDSEKAVELQRAVQPLPRKHLKQADSPIYSNITPKPRIKPEIENSNSARNSLSPTLAALALELPGFVPRSRKPYSQALETYNPQRVSEETLSQQWMSRLIALRQREACLNKRERDLISKEIINSPSTKVIPLNESVDSVCNSGSNGITLPPMLTRARVSSRRPARRGSSSRTRRRQSYGYEDLDSSLSADAGDGSMIITTTKFTKENMPRRNIFPEIATKKVHFTSSNPFVESDESVTLTFYELDNTDREGQQLPRQDERSAVVGDISKFKYLDLEKLTTEKRAAMNWTHSSPSKQARMSGKVFSDVTNVNSIRKTPSKASLTSKASNSSRLSMMSCRSQWSADEGSSKVSDNSISERTRSSTRQSMAYTPVVPPEVKKSKRKSLLPFKTPFKFKTSTKI